MRNPAPAAKVDTRASSAHHPSRVPTRTNSLSIVDLQPVLEGPSRLVTGLEMMPSVPDKDELLSAVVREANFLIMAETATLLRQAASPRERISAIIRANFPEDLFKRDVARAWVSFYSAIAQKPEFERLQNAVDRRLARNLLHALRQITKPERAERIATGIAVWIDGLWLRHGKSNDMLDSTAAIAMIEAYVENELSAGSRDETMSSPLPGVAGPQVRVL